MSLVQKIPILFFCVFKALQCMYKIRLLFSLFSLSLLAGLPVKTNTLGQQYFAYFSGGEFNASICTQKKKKKKKKKKKYSRVAFFYNTLTFNRSWKHFLWINFHFSVLKKHVVIKSCIRREIS